MFTFEDLSSSIKGSIEPCCAVAEKDKLGLALKGATDGRDVFFSNAGERAGRDPARRRRRWSGAPQGRRRGPVRMVNVAKDLASKGEIMIAGNGRRTGVFGEPSQPQPLHLRHRIPGCERPPSEAARGRQKKTLTAEELERLQAEARAAGADNANARAAEALELPSIASPSPSAALDTSHAEVEAVRNRLPGWPWPWRRRLLRRPGPAGSVWKCLRQAMHQARGRHVTL